MTPFRNRLKTPEEIELEQKNRKLERCKADLQHHERIYNALKSEIRQFEQVYEDMLGSRIEVLEELEWQLQGLLGGENSDTWTGAHQQEAAFSHLHHTTDLLDDDEELQADCGEISLRSLYRGVAKAVHPDLASDEADRSRRQELMALANEAYQAGNRQVLADLLSEWEQVPAADSGFNIATELVRVIRQIARVEQGIHAVIRQTEELKQTDIYLFKLRVDEATADGINLLAEMAARVDTDITRLRRRLATLKGEGNAGQEKCDPAFETRIVRFPADRSCGTLYVRNLESLDYRDWQQIGQARGAREVFMDKALRLDLKGEAGIDPDFLSGLQPNDLQSLFLYNVDDSALGRLTHLSGLQELYLSDTSITDQGLAQLRSLDSLKRISIYHTAVGDNGLVNLAMISGLKWLTCSGTAITEEGLNLFRRILPGCKAVSFKWRYEGARSAKA